MTENWTWNWTRRENQKEKYLQGERMKDQSDRRNSIRFTQFKLRFFTSSLASRVPKVQSYSDHTLELLILTCLCIVRPRTPDNRYPPSSSRSEELRGDRRYERGDQGDRASRGGRGGHSPRGDYRAPPARHGDRRPSPPARYRWNIILRRNKDIQYDSDCY